MNALLSAAFGFLAAVLVAGTAFALVRGLRAWRDARSLLGSLFGEAERLVEKTEAADGRVVRIAERAEELRSALERLSASRARLRLLLGATQEVRDLIGAVRAFVPR